MGDSCAGLSRLTPNQIAIRACPSIGLAAGNRRGRHLAGETRQALDARIVALKHGALHPWSLTGHPVRRRRGLQPLSSSPPPQPAGPIPGGEKLGILLGLPHHFPLLRLHKGLAAPKKIQDEVHIDTARISLWIHSIEFFPTAGPHILQSHGVRSLPVRKKGRAPSARSLQLRWSGRQSSEQRVLGDPQGADRIVLVLRRLQRLQV